MEYKKGMVTIKEIEKTSGERMTTLAWYANEGLLPHAFKPEKKLIKGKRTPNRHFPIISTLKRLEQIKKLKEEGLSINEIKEKLKEEVLSVDDIKEELK